MAMVIVAFTGQDGTGKSTQITRLRERLVANGMRVGGFHQFEPITPLGSAIRRLAKRGANALRRSRAGRRSTPGHDSTPQTDRIGSWPRRVIARIAAIGYLTVGAVRTRVQLLRYRRCDVVILDRTYADEIARTEFQLGAGRLFGLRMLRVAIPAPHLTLTFMLPEAVGWARKKTRELDLQEYTTKVGIIRELIAELQLVWDVVQIRVEERSPDDIAEDVWRELDRRWTR